MGDTHFQKNVSPNPNLHSWNRNQGGPDTHLHPHRDESHRGFQSNQGAPPGQRNLHQPHYAGSRDSSQSRDGSVEMADSNAPVEMDLDEDEMTSERTSEHAVAENAAAIEAARRKSLPAWIREGLERMDKEKTRKEDREKKMKEYAEEKMKRMEEERRIEEE